MDTSLENLAIHHWVFYSYKWRKVYSAEAASIFNEKFRTFIQPLLLKQADGYKKLSSAWQLDEIVEAHNQLLSLGKDIEQSLNDMLNALPCYTSKSDRDYFEDVKYRFLVIPKIHLLSYEHSRTILGELERYASWHKTSVAKIVKEVRLMYSHLDTLKGFYGRFSYDQNFKGLRYDRSYQDSKATPEEKAYRQFIRQSVLPHQDFFEIWASKVDDLSCYQSEVSDFIRNTTLEHRPMLEMFGEKKLLVSDSYRLKDGDLTPKINSDRNEKAQQLLDAYNLSAQNRVKELVFALFENKADDLKDRQKVVCEKALTDINDFIKFFAGIYEGIEKCAQELTKIIPQIEKMQRQWDTYVTQEAQRRMLAARNPEAVHEHNSKLNKWGLLGSVIVDGLLWSIGVPSFHTLAYVGSTYAVNQIRNYGTRVRQEQEQAIYQWAQENQTAIDPYAVRNALEKLESEFKKLSENKEFLQYLARNPMLSDIKALYMLLPRLVAGETNVMGMEKPLMVAGYKKIDDFIADIDLDNPRLAIAMKNFLTGLADSNDLKIIVAEANIINVPATPRESVLVAYTEKVIKEHYRDQSRQASIMDVLKMRNAIYTGHLFYSFNEVAKKDSDPALRALLGGSGSFMFAGNNDVRQIFDYYQNRHGEVFFVDLMDRNKRQIKLVKLIDDPSLKIFVDEASLERNANSLIPRVPSIFLEVCAYEFLLSQGKNIAKDRRLAQCPEALATLRLVNSLTRQIVMDMGIQRFIGHTKEDAVEGIELGALIAQSFVDFYSQMGSWIDEENEDLIDSKKGDVKEKLQKLRNAYFGENFSLANTIYYEALEDYIHAQAGVFVQVYKLNLEKYLEVATHQNKSAMLAQLDKIPDEKALQWMKPWNEVWSDFLMPHTEKALIAARYNNHSLCNAGIDQETWKKRAHSIFYGSKN